jgi:hypothetical protein
MAHEDLPSKPSGAERFPRIVADTLSGRTLVIPDCVDAGLAVVVLVFRRHAQAIVDSWMGPLARKLEQHTDVHLYEIPMLAGGWRVMSGFIDGGMRGGIPVHKHNMVATSYGDLTRVREALAIHDLDSAYVYAVRPSGEIIWSAEGWSTPERINALLGVAERETAGTEQRARGE